MVEQVAAVAARDLSETSYPTAPEGETEPKPIAPVDDIDQCLEAVADLALDIGYFSDLVAAERRLAMIRAWVQREMARYEDL
ncbi:MAG: hypothetical protein KGI43_00470 [Alphaproteobacteria bacterium]|nr:hypothetical protein [Alphaproteobacteria bacterium]